MLILQVRIYITLLNLNLLIFLRVLRELRGEMIFQFTMGLWF